MRLKRCKKVKKLNNNNLKYKMRDYFFVTFLLVINNSKSKKVE